MYNIKKMKTNQIAGVEANNREEDTGMFIDQEVDVRKTIGSNFVLKSLEIFQNLTSAQKRGHGHQHGKD